ncbi:acyl-CoA N-acyltransferase [Syncephalastrum racemosum]|uniref:Acyl-CoA N-acyltransferase n=1 Tax=Syncephalastrum racemosum TaxID=13706 RepID=A0A1X2HQS0_SYNRA|nr:acyl-CoA N-acyltransferase [Syncephalastrum racemosum]
MATDAKVPDFLAKVEDSDANVQELTDLFKHLSSNVTVELVRAAIESPQNKVFTASQDGRCIGALLACMTPCASGTRVHIEDVVVHPDYRRRGVATVLLKLGLDHAQKVWQARTIDLTSRPEREDANRLYRSLGFVQRNTNVYRYQPSY